MLHLLRLHLKLCLGLTASSMDDIATLEHLKHLHFDPKEVSVEDYTKLLKLLPRLTSLSVCLNPLVLESVKDAEATTLCRVSGVNVYLQKACSVVYIPLRWSQ